MEQALFVNGVYPSVLEEILAAQDDGARISFLQPHKGQVISMLSAKRPSERTPINLYASTTTDLSHIAYTATIIGWEDKRTLSSKRRSEVLSHLEDHQPKEVDLFRGKQKTGSESVNLITIKGLRKLETLFQPSVLRKVSDGLPLSDKRSQSGGSSPVYDQPDLFRGPLEVQDQHFEDLEAEVQKSLRLSERERSQRLAKAKKTPEKVFVVSVAYRRNPDVIATVLIRAKGTCETCGSSAPFNRRSDGSPYLEVHHRKQLSKGGEDTVENAVAVCPNCHRHAHHG